VALEEYLMWPFEVSGSNEVINNQMFDTNESKHVVKEGHSREL
jgi:penicillin amidase